MSKNTSSHKEIKYWAHLRGVESERLVIQYYTKLHYEIITQRHKTPFAEVDLLFRAPQGHVLMVEVKTSNIAEFMNVRISKKQKARLLRALTFLSENMNCNVEIHWAFVTINGEVTVIEDISG